MPVRSLNSSVLRWPDKQSVVGSLERWADKIIRDREDVLGIGYFGSYARGDWGVGSDLDVVIIVKNSKQPFERRGAEWDSTPLPIPTDVLVYTKKEWDLMKSETHAFHPVMNEIVWLYPQPKKEMESKYKSWMLQRKSAAERLEKQRASDLLNMSDSQARIISESVLSLATKEHLKTSQRHFSGLVEQQKYFQRWKP